MHSPLFSVYLRNNKMSKYNVIGLMSGTSMDGVDLAYCTFEKTDSGWKYELLQTKTYPYAQKWLDLLTNIHDFNANLVRDVDNELGLYFSQLIENFINDQQLVPDFISSHGHTAFHRPADGVTLQIGNGDVMSTKLRIPVVNDFRKRDVLLGGQGAPLVPMGDHLLFKDYDICLNLGGFSNVSYLQGNERLAFDICPVNMALNEASSITGSAFDPEGRMARSGDIHERILQDLEALDYYKLDGPRSLGREWYSKNFRPKMYSKKIPPIDLLATLTEHIALRISTTLSRMEGKYVLVTGGGCFNDYLIERIQALSDKDLNIPDEKLVSFKEALIFAFLGVLRMRNEVNVLSSVTGAPKDHCSGVIHTP